MLKRAGVVLACVLGWVVAADVAGVMVCVFTDIAPIRHKSPLLGYTIWFVLAVFTGLFAYNMAGSSLSRTEGPEWMDHQDAARTGGFVIFVSAVAFALLSGLFWWLWWQHRPNGELFVPDSMAPTLMFFGTILASMAFFRTLSLPQKRRGV